MRTPQLAPIMRYNQELRVTNDNVKVKNTHAVSSSAKVLKLIRGQRTCKSVFFVECYYTLTCLNPQYKLEILLCEWNRQVTSI